MSDWAEAAESNFRGETDDTGALQRYRTLLDTIDDGIYQLDTDGRFVAVNDVIVEITGYAREELLGEHVSTLLDEDGVSAIKREIERLRTNPSNRGDLLDLNVETADNEQIRLEVRVSPIEMEGTPQGSVGTVRDITERNRTEQDPGEQKPQGDRERELERSEPIIENLPVGIYRNTPGIDGEFIAGNATLAEIFDADSVDELLGCNVSDLYSDPEQRAEFSRQLERDGMVEDVELKQETLDGNTIWISVTAIKTEEDGEVYFDGIVQDITERKQAKQRLEQERDMFAQGPAIVFRWKPEAEDGWPVEYVSGNVEDAFGYTPQELESGDVPYTDLLLDEELDRIAREVEENSDETTERFSHDPYRIRTKDGDIQWVKDTTKIVRDETGDISHYLGYLVDITERKQHERELEASNERLEQFAFAASHDLQEPLRMVSSYLQLLESQYADNLDEDANEFIGFAVDGADRMRSMIENLLEYSRVTARGKPLEPTDSEAVLRDVLDDLHLQIEETDATITSDELPTVSADADQLGQVFQNLLKNALKYSGDEPPKVHVSAERSGDLWQFSVADEGIGIDPEYHDRIFTMFEQLQTDANESEAGGIGLALCERIVQRHDGEIWVESDPGEGSTFNFTIPSVESRNTGQSV